MPAPPATVLAMLACPVCRQSLAAEGHAVVERIRCMGCGRRYPIVDGIPVLIGSRTVEAG